MSIAFEPRTFLHEGAYPSMDEHQDPSPDADRFADPSDAVVNELANSVAEFTTAPTHTQYSAETEPARLQIPAATAQAPPTPSVTPKEDSPVLAPQRIKSIPKPDREVTRNAEGKFVCSYPNCTEEPREFVRKCEWSKHMDKHDRPYKCNAPGCEKLPGFTYSGGLLRHEREVHGKHGGPRNQFFCPHATCKRHQGKGFSRQENLNEHLRRVHTQNNSSNNATSAAATATTTSISNSIAPPPAPTTSSEVEMDDTASDSLTANSLKRKRTDETTTNGLADDTDLREEIKRVRQENEELRRQVQQQTRQTEIVMAKLAALQQVLEARIPTAASPPSTMAPAAATTTTIASPAMI